MLRIEHLTKVYGEKKAVDDLTIRITPGEIYGFINRTPRGRVATLRAAEHLGLPYPGEES